MSLRSALVLSRLSLRMTTAHWRKRPDFLIVGAQKAGTTFLYDYLMELQGFTPALKKEIHYFDLNHNRPNSWYHAHFSFRRVRGLTGEATPYYMFHPLAAERLAVYKPELRLIFILREPVSRAISHYHHAISHGFERRSIDEAIFSEEELITREAGRLSSEANYCSDEHQHLSYVSRGYYYEQLERFSHYFPKSQMLIYSSEHLFRAPGEVVADAAEFLGVEADLRGIEFTPRNIGGYEHSCTDSKYQAVVKYLKMKYRTPNAQLKEYYGIEFKD